MKPYVKEGTFAANLVQTLDAMHLNSMRHLRKGAPEQLSLDEWPTTLQLDFSDLEARVLASMTDPLYELRVKFANALRQQDKTLYYKWLYDGHLSNVERDTIAIVARSVRR